MALKIAADLLLVIPAGNFKYLLPFFTQEIVTEKRRRKVSRCSIAWLDTQSLGFWYSIAWLWGNCEAMALKIDTDLLLVSVFFLGYISTRNSFLVDTWKKLWIRIHKKFGVEWNYLFLNSQLSLSERVKPLFSIIKPQNFPPAAG